MYNDEKNLYHYTYRKDGSETVQPESNRPTVDEQIHNYQAGPQQPVQEMKPVKKDRKGMKLVALALVCALLGGAVGGGIVWGVGHSGGSTSVNVSSRQATEVAIKQVDGKTEMTDAEVTPPPSTPPFPSIPLPPPTSMATRWSPPLPVPASFSPRMATSSPISM